MPITSDLFETKTQYRHYGGPCRCAHNENLAWIVNRCMHTFGYRISKTDALDADAQTL